MHISVVAYNTTTKRVEKYKEFATLEEAEAHGGLFEAQKPVGGYPSWLVDDSTRVLTVASSPDLEISKSLRVDFIKSQYALHIELGFPTNGMLMDSLPSSTAGLRDRYDVAMRASQATMNVTDFNNVSHLSVNVSEVDTMITELGIEAALQYDKKQAKRMYINDSARTFAEINAVTWESVEV